MSKLLGTLFLMGTFLVPTGAMTRGFFEIGKGTVKVEENLVTFEYSPEDFESPPGYKTLSINNKKSPESVAVAGEFNDFSPTSWPLTWNPEKRLWILQKELSAFPSRYPQGFYFVLDGQGVENSQGKTARAKRPGDPRLSLLVFPAAAAVGVPNFECLVDAQGKIALINLGGERKNWIELVRVADGHLETWNFQEVSRSGEFINLEDKSRNLGFQIPRGQGWRYLVVNNADDKLISFGKSFHLATLALGDLPREPQDWDSLTLEDLEPHGIFPHPNDDPDASRDGSNIVLETSKLRFFGGGKEGRALTVSNRLWIEGAVTESVWLHPLELVNVTPWRFNYPHSGTWAKVITQAGKIGWLPLSNLAFLPPAQERQFSSPVPRKIWSKFHFQDQGPWQANINITGWPLSTLFNRDKTSLILLPYYKPQDPLPSDWWVVDEGDQLSLTPLVD